MKRQPGETVIADIREGGLDQAGYDLDCPEWHEKRAEEGRHCSANIYRSGEQIFYSLSH